MSDWTTKTCGLNERDDKDLSELFYLSGKNLGQQRKLCESKEWRGNIVAASTLLSEKVLTGSSKRHIKSLL